MKLNDKQYARIAELLPKQRGNVTINNRSMLDALLYRCKNGCSWRDLPKEFGDWHVIYVRFSRWAKNGVLDRIYAAFSEEGLRHADVYALDSTSVKVHPDAAGCLKKNGKQSIGRSRGGWNTKIHALTAGDTHFKHLLLSGGAAHDAPMGRLLLETAGKQETTVRVLMDRAYSDFKTRFAAWELKFEAVVPPKTNQVHKWEYDKELYKERNGIERFFRRIKAFRAVFTRYDKLDIVYLASVTFASIIILLRCVNTP
jgi:transposase